MVLASIVGCAAPARNVKVLSIQSTERHEHLGPEGTFVRLREFGNPANEPVVLIHGHGNAASHDYDRIIPRLADDYHVIALDLPGYGTSLPPAHPLAPHEFVEVLKALLDRRGLGSAHVVGHSMGGAIALLFASTYTDRVRSIALYDVAGILNFRQYAHEIVANTLAAQGDAIDPLRRIAHGLFRLASKPMSRVDLGGLPGADSSVRLFIQHDFGAALRGVRAPVLLGWGKNDRVAPSRTRLTLEFWLRPTQTIMYQRSGHVPMRTEPKKVSEDLIAFFAGAAQRPDERPSRRPYSALLSKGNYTCRGRSHVELVGDYDHIQIDRCKDVSLTNVRARTLQISRSTAELTHVELSGGEVGLRVDRSHVRWTGGRIDAHVCVETSRSHLNFAGVHGEYRRAGVVARQATHLMASVTSFFTAEGTSKPFHGTYSLPRTPSTAGANRVPELIMGEVP